MATRTYNGQLYQSATCEARLTTEDGFDFLLKTWEDIKIEYGAESKLASNSDGSPAGFTTDPVKTGGGMKIRREESDSLEDAVEAFYPDVGFLQVVFTLTVVYGNTLARLRKDTAQIKYQKLTIDLPKSQDPLMIDHPMLVLDYLKNGRRLIKFPV